MNKALFIPLNTNHVEILSNIVNCLKSEYVFLSHDKISDDNKYKTSPLLKEKGLPFVEFDAVIERSEYDSVIKKFKNFFKIKILIKQILLKIQPNVIILAVDNDPISYCFLRQAKSMGIKSVIVQEGSARPELKRKIRGLKNWVIELLRYCKIQIGYVSHGMSYLFDVYCVAGIKVKKMLENRGVKSDKIKITGQPKYDKFVSASKLHATQNKNNKRLLFAAGFNVISDDENKEFLQELIKKTKELNIQLTVKLHPRSRESIQDINNLFGHEELKHCDIIKTGDDTIKLLPEVYGLITVASTVITEALILDREGILVDYLAKGLKLPFSGYDAVFHIKQLNDLKKILNESLTGQKTFENKRKLLEDNLYLLDGKASERVAKIIEDCITVQ